MISKREANDDPAQGGNCWESQAEGGSSLAAHEGIDKQCSE